MTGVEAEGPDARAADAVVVDQVPLGAQRRGVLVVQLASAVVRRRPPSRPGRRRGAVPVVLDVLRAAAAEVVEHRCVGVGLHRRATVAVAEERSVGAGAVGAPLVAVVPRAEDHLARRRLGRVLLHGEGVVVRPAVERGVGRGVAGGVAEAHVVGHDEHRVDDLAEVADVHEAAVPARRPRVGGDRDLAALHRVVHLLGQRAHEGAELRLRCGVGAVGAALEVDVDAVEAALLDQGDGLGDGVLRGGRAAGDRVDGPVVHALDHQHDAVAELVRGVDEVAQVAAVPARPARVAAPDGVAVAVDADAEVGDGGEQLELPFRPVRQLPVRGVAEHVAGQVAVAAGDARRRIRRDAGGRLRSGVSAGGLAPRVRSWSAFGPTAGSAMAAPVFARAVAPGTKPTSMSASGAIARATARRRDGAS